MQVKFIEEFSGPRNVTVEVSNQSAKAIFRIAFTFETVRANSKYPASRKPSAVYFERFKQGEFNPLITNGSTEVRNMTDLFLQVERSVGYILDEAFRDKDRQEREALKKQLENIK